MDDVEIKDIAEVVVLPKVYVQPLEGKIKALLLGPAVLVPIESVMPELCVRVLV